MGEYGHKGADRQRRRERDTRARSLSRSHSPGRGRDDTQSKAERKAKRKRARTDAADDRRPPTRERGAEAAAPAAPPRAPADRGNWREEAEKIDATADDSDDNAGGGLVEMEEDDEDVERKIAESRARREALMTKWMNRGEDAPAGITFENTNTSIGAEEEVVSDNEEVTAFFAAQQAEEEKKGGSAGGEDKEKAIEEQRALNRYILEARGEKDGDMFGDGDEAVEGLQKAQDMSAAIGQTGASGDDWNDAEGYYKAKIGEMMGDRYRVTEDICGKGTFSNVVKADDTTIKDGMQVAIKVMRCNDMMRKAAEKEIDILNRLKKSDKENKRNVIRLLSTFSYRDHLCLVFECMWDNLRMALKKYTKDKGMSLKAVRAYTRQLLVALQHIHRHKLIHADIKPDNILISAGHNVVKICDLGSAMELTEVDITPYLVSRFYRAPEIVLGMKYGQPCDTFALGATLLECFTGKIMFPGKSNNDMLRHFMEWKGKPPHKMIKTGTTWKQHFDENLDFKFVDSDKMTRKRKVRIISECSAKKSILEYCMNRVGTEKQKSEDPEDKIYVNISKKFATLIDQMTMLDPEKRAMTTELLKHPFVAEAWPTPKGKPANKGAAPKA